MSDQSWFVWFLISSEWGYFDERRKKYSIIWKLYLLPYQRLIIEHKELESLYMEIQVTKQLSIQCESLMVRVNCEFVFQSSKEKNWSRMNK